MAKKKKFAPTAKERAYELAVCGLGCIICGSPDAVPHHFTNLRFGTGMGMKANSKYVIGLCNYHHLDIEVGIHASPPEFMKRHNTTEEELMEKRNELLGYEL